MFGSGVEDFFIIGCIWFMVIVLRVECSLFIWIGLLMKLFMLFCKNWFLFLGRMFVEKVKIGVVLVVLIFDCILCVVVRLFMCGILMFIRIMLNIVFLIVLIVCRLFLVIVMLWFFFLSIFLVIKVFMLLFFVKRICRFIVGVFFCWVSLVFVGVFMIWSGI